MFLLCLALSGGTAYAQSSFQLQVVVPNDAIIGINIDNIMYVANTYYVPTNQTRTCYFVGNVLIAGALMEYLLASAPLFTLEAGATLRVVLRPESNVTFNNSSTYGGHAFPYFHLEPQGSSPTPTTLIFECRKTDNSVCDEGHGGTITLNTVTDAAYVQIGRNDATGTDGRAGPRGAEPTAWVVEVHSGVTLNVANMGGGNRTGSWAGIWGGTLKVYGGKVNITGQFKGGNGGPTGGSGGKAPNLEVYGGMVNINAWRYGSNNSDRKGTAHIYGGSVRINDNVGMATPAQGVGGEVFQNTITLNSSGHNTSYGATADRKLVCGKINNADCTTGAGTSTNYGIKDVYTSSNIVNRNGSILYLWLPAAAQTIEMNQTTNCTPLRGNRVLNGNTATLTPQPITINYKCVGMGCANSNVVTRTENPQCH